MHFKSEGIFTCHENDEVERDAPSSADSDDEASENDDELPYNVEAFLNPVYDIEDLNIEDPGDITENDTNTGAEDEEPFEGIFNEFNFFAELVSSSSSEMSDDYEANEWEILERNNEQPDASNNPEGANLNSTQPGTSHNSNNEDLNNAHQGVLINQDISTSNNIESANLNSTEQSKSQNSDNEDLNNTQQGASSNKETSTTNDIKKANLNSTQQGAEHNSDNEGLNNAQQGACASSHLENNITNDINPNLFNDNCIFVTCDDERIEPIAISTPSFGTSYSPNIYYGRQNSGFETPESSASVSFNYRGHRNSRYPSPYSPNNGTRSDAGNMQPSSASGSVDNEATQSSENTSAPPVSNTTFSSQHHSAGNPGYATLHLLPRDTLLNHPGCPTSHHHLNPGRCFPGPYSTIFTAPNNRTYREIYSANYYGPDYPGYTGPRLANYRAQNNHGHVAPPPRNAPTYNPPRNNASYRTPQASSYDALDNLPSGRTQSTSYIAADASADGTADASAYEVPNASAYEVPNASGYGASTSFDQSDQLSPGQGMSAPPTYLGPHAYDYGNEYSPNYIALDSSSDATHYSQYCAPSPDCPGTLDVSENVTSQSPLTQVVYYDEASSSTASYNYGVPSISGYGTPARNEPTYHNASYRTPQAHDASDNLDPVTTSHGRPGWFFFTVYGGPDSISYISPNSTGYNASGMSGDAELGLSGGQRGRRHPFNSRSQSRSLPNSTRRHGRGRGDKHSQ